MIIRRDWLDAGQGADVAQKCHQPIRVFLCELWGNVLLTPQLDGAPATAHANGVLGKVLGHGRPQAGGRFVETGTARIVGQHHHLQLQRLR